MRLKRLIEKGIALMLFMCSTGPLFAEESTTANWWNLKAGSKGVYNSGLTEPYSYFSLYGEGMLKLQWIKCSLNGAHDFSSQISSGFGEYQYIDVNTASLHIQLSPLEFISAGGEYYTGRGDSSYTLREWSGFIRVGPDSFNLECAYGVADSQYLFNGTEIEVKRKNASITLAGDITDEISLDVAYDRSTLEFSNLTYEYNKNTVRAGIFIEVNEALCFIGGLSGGNDSAEYVILGADAGITVVLFSHVRLSGMYFFEQYLAPSTTTAESTKKGSGGSGSGGYAANPFMQSSKTGESFPSHRVSMSIVYSVH